MKRYVTGHKFQPTVRGYAPRHLPELRKDAAALLLDTYRKGQRFFNNRTKAKKAARLYTMRVLKELALNG